MRLLIEAGADCAGLMDKRIRELPYRRIQVDEIWSYVGKKQRQPKPEDDRTRVGDQRTFVAIDEKTKIVPSYLGSKRNRNCANFMRQHKSLRMTPAMAAGVRRSLRGLVERTGD